MSQRLSLLEKIGYGAGDAAANFVFMPMILFQANFYTEVFGIGAGAAAAILIVARLWDAIADPLVGAAADRTNTRWGKFRPWVIATAVPWCVIMVMAYSTPSGFSIDKKIAYAAVTNIALMSVYSMNNMPYAALGAVMTGDLNERATLNSYRFVLVSAAQFVVGGLTLPLVDRFSVGHDRQFGWQATTEVWALICLVLFLTTFMTTRERVRCPESQKRDFRGDLAVLLKNGPWLVMVLVTLLHFGILSFRGAAWYGYYHHYADSHAMYAWLQDIGLVDRGSGAPVSSLRRLLATLGFIVHDNGAAGGTDVADVFDSIINMANLSVTIVVMGISPALSRRFGKKAVAVAGLGLAGICSFGLYLLAPNNVEGMLIVTILTALFYAPTIPLIWAMYADVADYCEWTTGRRCTGMTFATICFALKCGLALGSAGFLWGMAAFFGYGPATAGAPTAVAGYRMGSGVLVALGFVGCAILLTRYKLNKAVTLRMADELPLRREAGGGVQWTEAVVQAPER